MRSVKPFYKVGIDGDDIEGTVERMQDSIEKSLNGLVQSSIVSGTLLKDISLSGTAKRVEHKLNREPLGYIIIRQNANAVIFEQDEVRKDIFLNLQASANVTVSLWVF